MSIPSIERQVRILALAPAPGVTEKAAFPSALRPSLGGITLLRLQLFGFYRLADGNRVACRTLEIDPNHIALSCPVAGSPGERIELDLDLLGIIQGVIEARMAAGLRVDVGHTYQDHIAQKLAWFNACLGQGAVDTDAAPFKERRAQRIVPRQTSCQFTDPDGVLHQADIINISCSGAAIKSTYLPLVGAPIVLGGSAGRRGLTVRRFEGGFAIAFLEPIPADKFRISKFF
jgi:hypothetical protein